MTAIAEQLRQRRRKMVKDLGGKVLWSLERMMTKFSKVSTEPFLDPYQFE